MTKLPQVWNEGLGNYISSSLKNEAARQFRVHQLPDHLEEWKIKKSELKRKIWQSIRVQPDHELALDYRETGSIELDGYCIKKIYYQSRKDFYVTANLYVPNDKGPFPGVLSLQGHYSQGKVAEKVQAQGHSLAKNGYVCLIVDAFGSGERAITHGEYEYHGFCLGGSLFNVGETLLGAHVIDNMRGIDLLCSLPYVDSNKIGVTGSSGGGNQTMWLAALDERVKAVVPVVSVGTFESYIMERNCYCELLPDGLTFTEESGVLALVAPRALKICSCLQDSCQAFHPTEMLRSYAETRKIFQQCNADDKLAYQIFNLPHGYWPEIREAMLGWFDLHLKGIGTGAPKQEIQFKVLPEDDLMVFERGKRDRRIISIAEYCRKRGSELETENQEKDYSTKEKCDELAEILRLQRYLALKSVHDYGKTGKWHRFALETECGRLVPVIIKEPGSNCEDFLIAAAPDGKNDLLETKIFKTALQNNYGIVLFDLYGTGETAQFEFPACFMLCRVLQWLGRNLLGEWVKDYALVKNFIQQRYPSAQLTYGGFKEAGIAALFCAYLGQGKNKVILERSTVSLQYNVKIPESYSALALLLPDFLKWGDIKQVVTSIGSDVKFIDPIYFDGEPVIDE